MQQEHQYPGSLYDCHTDALRGNDYALAVMHDFYLALATARLTA